ncbi:MAG: hypothetical protein L3J69_00195 [Desulfobacula sp.]|nr:hypothetical protein [Desulfobacula sp.]
MGLIGLFFAVNALAKEENEREKVIDHLKTALDEVKNLSGLLPSAHPVRKSEMIKDTGTR